MFKVVSVDNFDRESSNHPGRELSATPLSQATADAVASVLNERQSGGCSDIFWRVVPFDYKCRTYVPAFTTVECRCIDPNYCYCGMPDH